MPIASQIKQYMADSSWIRRMFELGITMKKERGEHNVFDLSLGNPVAEPPPEFLVEMHRLLDELPAGSHRYTGCERRWGLLLLGSLGAWDSGAQAQSTE